MCVKYIFVHVCEETCYMQSCTDVKRRPTAVLFNLYEIKHDSVLKQNVSHLSCSVFCLVLMFTMKTGINGCKVALKEMW